MTMLLLLALCGTTLRAADLPAWQLAKLEAGTLANWSAPADAAGRRFRSAEAGVGDVDAVEQRMPIVACGEGANEIAEALRPCDSQAPEVILKMDDKKDDKRDGRGEREGHGDKGRREQFAAALLQQANAMITTLCLDGTVPLTQVRQLGDDVAVCTPAAYPNFNDMTNPQQAVMAVWLKGKLYVAQEKTLKDSAEPRLTGLNDLDYERVWPDVVR